MVIMIGFLFVSESDLMSLAGDILTCLMLCISLYAVSGKKTFEHCGDRTGYVFRTGWPILTFTLFFFVVGMGYSIADRLPMNPDWISRLGLTFIMMFFAGVNEELCYRAIASDVLLPRLRNTKHPFLYTAIISGLVFGIVHVFLGEYNSLLSIVLAALKILTTFTFGASLMILYWKTRNVLAIGILHGIYDLLPSITDCLFVTEQAAESTGYTDGDMGSVIVYLIQLAVNLIVLHHIYRKAGTTIDFKKTLEDW